jgi:hypothetical protein
LPSTKTTSKQGAAEAIERGKKHLEASRAAAAAAQAAEDAAIKTLNSKKSPAFLNVLKAKEKVSVVPVQAPKDGPKGFKVCSTVCPQLLFALNCLP